MARFRRNDYIILAVIVGALALALPTMTVELLDALSNLWSAMTREPFAGR